MSIKSRAEIQSEILKEALDHERCGLAVSVGLGKTLIGLNYINNFFTDHLRVLIVAPKHTIFQVWREEAIKFNMEYLLGNIDFVTYLSLSKRSHNYDIVILEEMHSLKLNHKPWLSKFQGRIVGLTGTAPKYHHSEKGMMVDEFCPVVYDYHVDEAIGDDILNDYRIVVHSLQLSTKKDFQVKGKKGSWVSSELDNYRYWSKRVYEASNGKEEQITRIMRMKALMSYKTKERYAKTLMDSIGDKVILFGNEQAQVDRMCKYTYHSKNLKSEENLEKFKSGEITKLGAVGMLSEGVNIPGLKQAIVMHSFSASSPATRQKLGRILRLNPDETAVMHCLQYTSTIDEKWLTSVLEDFDSSKIIYK